MKNRLFGLLFRIHLWRFQRKVNSLAKYDKQQARQALIEATEIMVENMTDPELRAIWATRLRLVVEETKEQ